MGPLSLFLPFLSFWIHPYTTGGILHPVYIYLPSKPFSLGERSWNSFQKVIVLVILSETKWYPVLAGFSISQPIFVALYCLSLTHWEQHCMNTPSHIGSKGTNPAQLTLLWLNRYSLHLQFLPLKLLYLYRHDIFPQLLATIFPKHRWEVGANRSMKKSCLSK